MEVFGVATSITQPWQGLRAVLWDWCRGECCQKYPLFELLVNTACRRSSGFLNRPLRSPAAACLCGDGQGQEDGAAWVRAATMKTSVWGCVASEAMIHRAGGEGPWMEKQSPLGGSLQTPSPPQQAPLP